MSSRINRQAFVSISFLAGTLAMGLCPAGCSAEESTAQDVGYVPVALPDSGGRSLDAAAESDAAVQPDVSGPDTSATDTSVSDTSTLTDGDAAGQAVSDARVDGNVLPDGASPNPCDAPTTCPTVRDMRTISGDETGPSVAARGYRSEWLKIRVTENNDSMTSRPAMRAKYTLISPPDANFDLYVYMASKNEQTLIECNNVTNSSTSTSPTDIAYTELGDGTFSSDESRNITIEVRFVSGTCRPDAEWNLLVEGNKGQ